MTKSRKNNYKKIKNNKNTDVIYVDKLHEINNGNDFNKNKLTEICIIDMRDHNKISITKIEIVPMNSENIQDMMNNYENDNYDYDNDVYKHNDVYENKNISRIDTSFMFYIMALIMCYIFVLNRTVVHVLFCLMLNIEYISTKNKVYLLLIMMIGLFLKLGII